MSKLRTAAELAAEYNAAPGGDIHPHDATSLLHFAPACRREWWEHGRTILDKATTESRDLYASEQREWGKVQAQLDALDDLIARARKSDEEYHAAIAPYLNVIKPPIRDGNGRDTDQLRALLRGEVRSVDIPLRDAMERRDLMKVSGGAAGAYTVPTSFSEKFVEHLVHTSPIRAVASVWVTSGGEDLQVPKTDAYGTATIVGEGSAISESDPSFAQMTLKTWKYGKMIQVSNELLQDTAIDLDGFLARESGLAIGLAQGAHFAVGTGTNQPNGIVTASTAGGTAASAGAVTADELITLLHTVPPPYRQQPGCAWLMNDSTFAAVRKLKTSGGGDYILQTNYAAGEPPSLLGHRVYIDNNIASMGSATFPIVVGDLSRYVIRDGGSLRWEASQEFAFDRDVATFRCLLRSDGNLADTNATRKLKMGSS
jgi:HK97 family phage major capsid protein